jgi:hypothetical protein
MDKRREPRFQVDQPVVLTILTEPQTRLDAVVKNASGRGLGLLSSCPVPAGAPLRIEIDGSIVLGESIYCREDRDGHFIGVELDQVLVGLTELARNLAAYAPEFELEARRP